MIDKFNINRHLTAVPAELNDIAEDFDKQLTVLSDSYESYISNWAEKALTYSNRIKDLENYEGQNIPWSQVSPLLSELYLYFETEDAPTPQGITNGSRYVSHTLINLEGQLYCAIRFAFDMLDNPDSVIYAVSALWKKRGALTQNDAWHIDLASALEQLSKFYSNYAIRILETTVHQWADEQTLILEHIQSGLQNKDSYHIDTHHKKIAINEIKGLSSSLQKNLSQSSSKVWPELVEGFTKQILALLNSKKSINHIKDIINGKLDDLNVIASDCKLAASKNDQMACENLKKDALMSLENVNEMIKMHTNVRSKAKIGNSNDVPNYRYSIGTEVVHKNSKKKGKIVGMYRSNGVGSQMYTIRFKDYKQKDYSVAELKRA